LIRLKEQKLLKLLENLQYNYVDEYILEKHYPHKSDVGKELLQKILKHANISKVTWEEF
jgi:predicted RNA binding protein YcfA (HicA-like mRNA interferase family)